MRLTHADATTTPEMDVCKNLVVLSVLVAV
jgi:hypothetical protein